MIPPMELLAINVFSLNAPTHLYRQVAQKVALLARYLEFLVR
jgi:hypothetical protein